MPTVPAPPLTLDAAWPSGDRTAVRLGPPFAEGGDATVHPVEGHPALVAKVYRDPSAEPRRRAKLDAMLAAPPGGALAAEGGEVALSWPVALLEGGGAAEDAAPAGFLMPRVDLSGAVSLELLLSARARRAAGLPESYRFRVSVAANLAALVAALHAQGHHVVDLKPANVHVYRASGRVAVLDCDGMSVAGRGGERFPAHQYTDGYIAPEAARARVRPEGLGEAQDRFALAVLVFRLLCNGLHPFQGVPGKGAAVPTTDGERVAAGLYPYGRGGAGRIGPPPSSLYPFFGRTTQVLFNMAFDGPPEERPSADAWRGHLRGLLEGGLRPCDAAPSHARFPGQPCGACVATSSTPSAASRPALWRSPTWGEARTWPGRATIAAVEWFDDQPAWSASLLLLILVLGGTSGLLALVVWASAPPSPSVEDLFDQAVRENRVGDARALLQSGVDLVDRSVGVPLRPFRGEAYAPLDKAIGYPGDGPVRCDVGPSMYPDVWIDAVPPLYHAAVLGNVDMVALLLAHRTPVNPRRPDERTALMLTAAACGQTVPLSDAVVEDISRAGRSLAQFARRAASDAGAGGETALWRGALQVAPDGLEPYDVRRLVRNAAVLHLLLDAGADVDARDGRGRAALSYAATFGNRVAVHVLLAAGADPNAADDVGATPLMVTADQATAGWSDSLAVLIARDLIAAGGRTDATDGGGRVAAAFVGERTATCFGKRDRFGERQSFRGCYPFLSLTRALLGGEGAQRETARSAFDPADLGDGGTRFVRVPDLIDVPTGTPPPLDGDTLTLRATGVCEGDGPRRVQLWLTAVRTGLGQTAIVQDVLMPLTDLYRVPRACRADVFAAGQPFVGRSYDVSADPERWPRKEVWVRLRYVPPPPGTEAEEDPGVDVVW